MKTTFLFLLIVILQIYAFAQTKPLQFHLRIPVHYELQRAEVFNSLGSRTVKGNAVNFGVDALLQSQLNKTSLFTGIGFFRNQFNIKRQYDHQKLNEGRDSLPIGTDANNYTYSLIRFPLGIFYEIVDTREFAFNLGIEHILNFSFRRKYNGRVPYEGANTVYKGFNFFGNSINLLLNFKRKKLELEPYVRLYNCYRKDRFLKENESEFASRQIDAYGIGFKYQFKL